MKKLTLYLPNDYSDIVSITAIGLPSNNLNGSTNIKTETLDIRNADTIVIKSPNIVKNEETTSENKVEEKKEKWELDDKCHWKCPKCGKNPENNLALNYCGVCGARLHLGYGG